MSKVSFQLLADKIEDIIGPDNFKSKQYLNNAIQGHGDGSRNIIVAHQQSTGGMLSGEMKLALSLRVLGGGTYMDMALLMETSFNHVHKIVKETIFNFNSSCTLSN